MGWCSATVIFDAVARELLDNDQVNKKNILKILIDILEDLDWDCHDESQYYNHPVVKEIFKEKHPRWFEDEDSE